MGQVERYQTILNHSLRLIFWLRLWLGHCFFLYFSIATAANSHSHSLMYEKTKIVINTHLMSEMPIDEFQINEINVDLRTSGFDNEVLSVDACAV